MEALFRSCNARSQLPRRRPPHDHASRTTPPGRPDPAQRDVVGEEARQAFAGLVLVHGEPAPGPPECGLRLPPAPSTLADLPYYDYHPFGVERRRAELIRRVAARAGWFEGIVNLPLPDAYARLMAVPGIGPWTAAEVAVRALGDEDAVSVGDFHLPNLIAFARATAVIAPNRGVLDSPLHSASAVPESRRHLCRPPPSRRRQPPENRSCLSVVS